MSLLNDLVIDPAKWVRGKTTEKVDPKVQAVRLNECLECPMLRYSKIFKVHYCGICKCPVQNKVEYADEECANTEHQLWQKML